MKIDTKRKRNTKRKTNTKNKKMTIKGGQPSEIENYKFKISEIGKQCIENIQFIHGIPHLVILNNELDKIKFFLEQLLKEIHSKSTNEELYSYIKSIYEKDDLKLYHFNNYTKHSTSSLLFINILENEISLMKKMIDLINQINIPESPEIKNIKERYENVSNEFASKLPCLEQFVTTIYPRVIKPLEAVVEKYNDKYINNENVNNVNEIMNINDFHYDGDFYKHYNPTYDLPNYILLSLLSFRKSLCNNNNDCEKNNELITKSYNENNYKQYLEFIRFFNNEKYKTIGIDWNELKNIFNSYQLDLPNTSDFLNEKMCCLHELNDRQQQIVGGKKLQRK